MITKVYGRANDAEIILEHVQGTTWRVDVPWRQDGRYTVEIWAENDAGRKAYYCTCLMVISGHKLQCYVLPEGYAGMPQLNYMTLPTLAEYTAAAKNGGYAAGMQACGYDAKAQEGGYGVEYTICSRCDG